MLHSKVAICDASTRIIGIQMPCCKYQDFRFDLAFNIDSSIDKTLHLFVLSTRSRLYFKQNI